jgi:hypothetical protein
MYVVRVRCRVMVVLPTCNAYPAVQLQIKEANVQSSTGDLKTMGTAPVHPKYQVQEYPGSIY